MSACALVSQVFIAWKSLYFISRQIFEKLHCLSKYKEQRDLKLFWNLTILKQWLISTTNYFNILKIWKEKFVFLGFCYKAWYHNTFSRDKSREKISFNHCIQYTFNIHSIYIQCLALYSLFALVVTYLLTYLQCMTLWHFKQFVTIQRN